MISEKGPRIQGAEGSRGTDSIEGFVDESAFGRVLRVDIGRISVVGYVGRRDLEARTAAGASCQHDLPVLEVVEALEGMNAP